MAKEVWTRERVEYILAIAQDTVSLNTPVNPNDDYDETELGDFIEDVTPSPEDELLTASKRDTLYECMRRFLSPREAAILKMRYGFETEAPMTLQEIGDELQLTRERVRQLELKALRKLRLALLKREITEEDI